MAKLAIKGHPTRGKGVIELLEMLGGDNEYNKTGSVHYEFYYIGHLNRICSLPISESYRTYVIFTLEEFLEKFPYKVGDKVLVLANTNYVYTIKSMTWDTDLEKVSYRIEAIDDIENEFDWYADELIYYSEQKEKTMEEIIKIDIPKGYEFAGVDDNKQQVVFTKIQIEYPKTYEECFNIWFGNHHPVVQVVGLDGLGNNKSLFERFIKLKICRDAYWKIAGEQMGLDKPWEPDYNEGSYEQGSPIKHVIYYTGTYITKGQKCTPSYILAFPTAEMRDAFKVNFDDDIEFCKEFL